MTSGMNKIENMPDARVTKHEVMSNEEAIALTLSVRIASDTKTHFRKEVIIDTDRGSNEESSVNSGSNRYSIDILSRISTLLKDGFSTNVVFSIVIPFERALKMERYNRVYLLVDRNGVETKVRLVNDKPRQNGIAEVTPIPNSSAAIYFNDTLKLFKIEVRERQHTDDPKEQRKLELAYKLSRLARNHRPVVMYEKDCSRYEESASAVYEALIDKGYKDVYYILDKNYRGLKDINPKYKKNIIDRFSFRHYYELFCARSIISTETLGHSLERGSVSIPFNKHIMKGNKDYVFLQHGVMYMIPLSAEQRSFFSKAGIKGKQRVVVSSQLEAKHFMDNTSYDSPEKIYLSGLPKFDRSIRNDKADKIVIMITWRPWDYNMMMKEPKATSYYKFVERLYEAVPDQLKEHVVIAPHPLVTKITEGQSVKESSIWANYDPHIRYDDLLKDCDVLITDYSSIAYDAFYRGCNVIFCWEEMDECMKHYGKDVSLMLTEDLAFGPVCYETEKVSEDLSSIYRKDQDSAYVNNYRKIVEFHDGKNTERVVEMLSRDRII